MSDGTIRIKGHLENGLFVTTTPFARYPLKCRPNSSDPYVFQQVFVDREYACLEDIAAVNLVIDCGANVGYSAAYLLSRFDGCDLIAVEPDASNYELLCENLRPYGSAVQTMNTAVWSHPTRLTISETKYRGGREWSRQVRECTPADKTGFEAVDIGGLLSQTPHPRISILKIDVEGAEAVIFSKNTEPWIDRVDNMVIELHDDSIFGNASAIFAKAVEGKGFAITRYGELTVCKRRR